MQLLRTMIFRLLTPVFAALFSTLAVAAGPYDSIYNLPGTAEYLTVHQNGTNMIVGHFKTLPASGIVFYLGDGQAFQIQRADMWDLYSGVISGNTVVLVGEMAYGACESTKRAVFSASGVTITQVSIRNTPAGTAAGISCGAYQTFFVNIIGTTSYWPRVF